jgi:hypothetical protein
MTNIERRNNEGNLANIGFAPTSDPTSYTWSPIVGWEWQSFGELPQSIVAQISNQRLLPSNIILENFPAPVDGSVDAWIIGSNGFSVMKIVSSGAQKWDVIGRFTPFKAPTLLLTSSMYSELNHASNHVYGSNLNSNTGIELSEKLSSASILPESLRKKLIAVKSPWHEHSSVYSNNSGPGGVFNYVVHAFTANATQVFALQAIQQIQVFVGESEEQSAQRLNSAPWSVEMVYEKFA